jgi:endonuclease/exonuclease/phosphatase family metal-dependent hydrolase
MHPDSSWFTKRGYNTLLLIKSLFLAAIALITTVLGVALRFTGNLIQKNPFISWETVDSKQLPENRTFTMASWNVCCMVAGFAIGENLPPWKYRIDRIVANILKKNTDVVCLYETFDTSAAFMIAERLKSAGYHFGYFNIGARALGVSSGLMVASRYKIVNPEFTPFPKDTLLGVSKFSSKGFFTFNLESDATPFAKIITTHLQHSEIAQWPTREETEARGNEMTLIGRKAAETPRNLATIVTGDLNLDDKEYDTLGLGTLYDKGTPSLTESFPGNIRQQTGPLNLDHTMAVRNGAVRSIETTIDPGDIYNGLDYLCRSKIPCSDHRLLKTTLELNLGAEHFRGVDPEVKVSFGDEVKSDGSSF